MIRHILLILTLTAAINLSAQNQSDTTDFFTGKALLFKLNGLAYLGLDNFNGGIGLKKRSWLFEEAFSRFSFDFQYFNLNHSNSPYQVSKYEATNIIEDVIYYFKRRSDIRPYLGMGFRSGVSVEKNENDRFDFHDWREIRSVVLAGRGIVGFEYFWKENVTFSAEYLGEGSFTYGEQLYEFLDKSTGLYYHNPKGFSRDYKIILNTTSFILSIYF